jgi:hypothetical protein
MATDLAERRRLSRTAYDEALRRLKVKYPADYKEYLRKRDDEPRKHRNALKDLRDAHRHDFNVIYAELAVEAGIERPRANKDLMYWRMAQLRAERKT